MEKIIVRVLAISFLLVGVGNLVSPESGLGLFEFELSTTSVLNEARANYGGMHVFLGLLLWFWSLKRESVMYALVLAFMFCTGLIFGRIVSFVVDGMPNEPILVFAALELLLSIVCAVLLMKNKRSAV
jgi:hypothetical protein